MRRGPRAPNPDAHAPGGRRLLERLGALLAVLSLFTLFYVPRHRLSAWQSGCQAHTLRQRAGFVFRPKKKPAQGPVLWPSVPSAPCTCMSSPDLCEGADGTTQAQQQGGRSRRPARKGAAFTGKALSKGLRGRAR